MTLVLTEPQRHPEPTPEADTQRWERPRVLLAVGAIVYLTMLTTLLAWSVLPAVLGWSAYVVQSDSMGPTVRAGDVLVSAPVDDAAPLERGQIVVVEDPAQPGSLLSHRVARVRDDGFLITRGDANAQADSTPVPPEAVRGRGRLLVPYVGLPQRWWAERDHALLVGWLLVTGVAVVGVVTDPARRQRSAEPQPRRRQGRPRHRAPARFVLAPGVRLPLALLVVTATAVPATEDGPVSAAFRNTTGNPANSFAARPDWVPPDAGAVTVAKTKNGYLTGYVAPSGTYRVYANVTDTGNPASGTASVRADTSQLTSGATTTALSSPSSTDVGGTTYNYSIPVGSPLTVGSTVSEGSKPWTLTMTDVAGFSRTRNYDVTVDGTKPTAVDVQAINASGTPGKPDAGDTFTWTYSERIDPYSILSGWTGAAQPVLFVIDKVTATNVISVWIAQGGNKYAQLPLGTVDTDKQRYVQTADYVWLSGTMTQSGNAINVVLGSVSSGALNTSVDTSPSPLTWTPNGAVYDAAGNTLGSVAPGTESGASDLDF
jgi:signal peptidase I